MLIHWVNIPWSQFNHTKLGHHDELPCFYKSKLSSQFYTNFINSTNASGLSPIPSVLDTTTIQGSIEHKALQSPANTVRPISVDKVSHIKTQFASILAPCLMTVTALLSSSASAVQGRQLNNTPQKVTDCASEQLIFFCFPISVSLTCKVLFCHKAESHFASEHGLSTKSFTQIIVLFTSIELKSRSRNTRILIFFSRFNRMQVCCRFLDAMPRKCCPSSQSE
jgi:hypothetical protein